MMGDSGGLVNIGKGRQTAGAGLFLLFVSAVLYWLGFSMLRPMLALYFNAAGLPLAGVGAVMGLHALIPVVLAMPAGQVIDRIGPRKSVMAGALIMLFSGGCYIAGGTLDMLLPMMIGQLFNGTGSLLCWGALQASVGQIARAGGDKKRSVHLLSNFAFINALAQFGGPALGGIFADTGGMVWVFLVFAVLSGIVLLLSPLLPGAIRLTVRDCEGEGAGIVKPAGTRGKFSFGMRGSYSSGIRLLRDNRPFGTAMLFNGLLFTLIDIQGTFLPVYLANMGYSPLHVGTLLSAGAVSSIVIRPLTGFFINRFGHRPMMMGCLWAGGLCLGVLVFEPGYGMILGVMLVWGMCSGMNQPMALILVAHTVPADSQGMGMSLRTMANRVVQVVNPLAVGGVSAVVGLTNSFGFMALFLVVCSFAMNKKLEERPSAGG
ncbi:MULTISPECIES: MFS transporter [unclassified Paenibacillus]|uniref:MFS transporter n=1 Tax=unclassified Paenibacillus TaxID=185978 RepID=UPI002405CA00|nr:MULTISPECIES: MFS transporter [unclassified Paenibacillus]MDF9842046.1 MFS family permease [Paenibacillus sp. PastF-2]MDF9848700.1 MFS family permease [Paenibacillus sp. PastM-2]MDF9855269.1 MFS family permease [Paenibacillus sp. PastF-1]MDH6480540.1 MFS family permease [Paenibacillus sp. PastH-2]MDH6507967.1 MFS family permease [Paenibacillus sp. PastM-3]